MLHGALPEHSQVRHPCKSCAAGTESVAENGKIDAWSAGPSQLQSLDCGVRVGDMTLYHTVPISAGHGKQTVRLIRRMGSSPTSAASMRGAELKARDTHQNP